MEKFILVTVYFMACLLPAQAQVFYGTTSNGGNEGGGTINKFLPATNSLTVAKHFESFPANPYYTNLILASDGKLYGVTAYGGNRGFGIIFSFDPSTSRYKKLKDFDYNNGGNPYGSLIQAHDGKLYGMTYSGGSEGYGVIFSYDPTSTVYLKLKDFDSNNGATPFGSLVEASDGRLYGMTSEGGTNGAGVVFSYNPSLSTYKKLANFSTAIGSNPYGSLIEARDGKLYGTTVNGGSNAWGTIFSFDPSASTLKKLKDFDGQDGGNSYGSFVEASDGKLYGMTKNGGISRAGVIFSFDPSVSTYTILKDFSNTTGGNPSGSLVQASNGKLYGLTPTGGGSRYGTIFSFDPSSSDLIKLKDFDNVNGNGPQGSLTSANNGKLYGLTFNGGSGGAGVIFSFDPFALTLTKVKDFGDTEGTTPTGSMVQVSDGKLYGMTNSGGNWGYGVIFSFDISTSTYTILKNFDNTNGANPTGSLIQATDGKLYGVTLNGGSHLAGVIFSFDRSSATYTKLYDFVYRDGANPFGSLTEARDGKLYGMTYGGGANRRGTIFSFDPSTSNYSKLKDLDYFNGGNPRGSLMQASNGKLYGVTDEGGSNENGTIFSYDPSTRNYKKLKDFDFASGTNPKGSLTEASDGKLYGMTSKGGTKDFGTIFSFDPSTSSYAKLNEFNNLNGAYPLGSLLKASDGKLFGVTYGGGANGYGVIFSYDPNSSYFMKLKDFNLNNGSYPGIGSAFIEVKNDQNHPPTVSITTPSNNAIYLAPAAHIKLSAAAADKDGTISKVEFYNGSTLLHTETVAPYGFVWRNVPRGNYTLTVKATDNSGLVTTSAAVHISVVPNKLPTVNIIIPANNHSYPAPATIHLEAAAKDPDGRITKVEFYSESTLLQTELKPPYTFAWRNVPVGDYNIIAKATDNWGAVTPSAVIHVSVHPNIAPTVSITIPANGKSFTAPAIIDLAASAKDSDGRITKVEFYNGTVLLRTERKLPYSYHWQNVPAGTYTITAVATDNYGLKTTSAPITVTVTDAIIVSSRPCAKNDKTASNDALQLSVFPNPVTGIVNISTSGLQRDKPATLSIFSASGVAVKTIQISNKIATLQMDVSLLPKGVYNIRVVSGSRVMYNKLVKL